jgi:hypothetical protein
VTITEWEEQHRPSPRGTHEAPDLPLRVMNCVKAESDTFSFSAWIFEKHLEDTNRAIQRELFVPRREKMREAYLQAVARAGRRDGAEARSFADARAQAKRNDWKTSSQPKLTGPRRTTLFSNQPWTTANEV